MNYRAEIQNANGCVCEVRCYQADTGVGACETAQRILDNRHQAGEYAEVSVDDGTGQYLPYATVSC